MTWFLSGGGAGAPDLAGMLPDWRDVLAGNPRFAARPSHARSLGQRIAALCRAGLLEATGDHAQRLSDESGFRGREPEPAYGALSGGLVLTQAGHDTLA